VTRATGPVAEPLVLVREAACRSGAHSVAPLGAVCLPASLAPYPIECDYPVAPLLYAAQPDSLGFFDDYVMHEPCLDEVGAESHCNVAMWLNDSMC